MNPQLIRHIERLIEDDSFHRWCFNKTSPERTRYWDQWSGENKIRQQATRIAFQIVAELGLSYHPIPTHKKYVAWKVIAGRIQKESGISARPVYSYKGYGSSRYTSWKYASVAIMLLLLISFLTLSYSTIIPTASDQYKVEIPTILTKTTNYGERKTILLDSGTKIILNANSTLTHFKGWVYDGAVRVSLSGEAYFDVVERASAYASAFEVETADGNIHVLGTRFAVSTWNEQTQVVLEEGNVAVRKSEGDHNSNEAILNPNEIAHFSKYSTDVKISSINPRVFTSWTRGLFVFDHTPVKTVASRIENTFGVKVDVSDSRILSRKVSGSIEGKNVETVILALAKSLQLTVTEIDDTFLLAESLNQSLNPNE